MPFLEDSKEIPWPSRALELNRYLLDGANPDGTPWQRGNRFPDKTTAGQRIDKRTLVRLVVEEAVHVRVCQLFVEGNHGLPFPAHLRNWLMLVGGWT